MSDPGETCVICRRWAPDVLIADDVPIAFLPERVHGRRFHVGCVAHDILPALVANPGLIAALRVASAVARADAADAKARRH